MFGLLNLNKPSGCTSRDVVDRVTRLVGRKIKVGHAGTLDPLAQGVLVVCVGPATRLVPLIHEHLKSYEATFLSGCRSQTDDTEGTLEKVDIPASFSESNLRELLPEFTGRIQQVPPAFSAVKVDGKRAYKVARQGKDVQLSAREVIVTRLELTDFQPSQFSFSIDCGTGTYIRSIGRDLARRLGTEAVMTDLVRTRVGPFTVETACDVETLSMNQLRSALSSPLIMLEHLRQIKVTSEDALRLRQGRTLPWPEDVSRINLPGETLAITMREGELFAIAHEQQGRIAPQIVLGMRE